MTIMSNMGRFRAMKRSLSLVLALALLFSLVIPGAILAAPAPVISFTTNGRANDYGAGANMFVLGRITAGASEPVIPIPNAALVLDAAVG